MDNSPAAPANRGHLNDVLGVEWLDFAPGSVRARMAITPGHMAPNGFLHAASIITLADSACGVGSIRSLPEGATSFTTIELKSNFLGTAKVGETIACQARLIHGGRSTQVWDAEVVNETRGKPVALFRCTQLALYPRP